MKWYYDDMVVQYTIGLNPYLEITGRDKKIGTRRDGCLDTTLMRCKKVERDSSE